MAIQRQNPQFDPQRIVQPTSVPIDTYFRPMLRQPEQPKILQVAAALADISPQLGRLASDAMAANIEAQKEYGAYEASSEKDPEVLRRKATEAIENSGGIAPWRYQAFLEAYGQRLVRDKYRNELYNNLDDLSNPYNEDGTVRPPTYVAEQMAKLYEAAGVPTNSYYMNKGAAAARAEADNSFYERLMGARRQKVMQGTEDSFMDGLTFALQSNPDPDKAFSMVKEYANGYYRQGGQNGDQLIAQVSVNVAKGYVADKDYERARALLDRLLNPKEGDRAIGNRHRPEVQQMLDMVNSKERENEFEDMRQDRTLKDNAQIEMVDRMLPLLQEMQAKNGGFVSMTDTELLEFVKKNSSGLKSSEQVVNSVQGRVVSTIRDHIEGMNRPRQKDRRQQNDTLNIAYQNSRTMSQTDFFEYSTGLLRNEMLDFDQVMTLRNMNRQFSGMSAVDRDLANDRIRSLQGSNWAGLSPNQIAVDGASWIMEQGNRASADVMSEWTAAINTQDFKNKYPDDTQRALAQDRVLVDLIQKKRAELMSQYKTEVDRFNLTGSFDATVGPMYGQQADQFVELMLKQVGIEPNSIEYDSLASRSSQILLDRIRDEWGQIYAPSGSSPMSLEERKRELYRRIPDIKDRFYLEMRNNPDSLGLPSQLSNRIKANTRPPAAGTLDTAPGKAPSQRPVSTGISEFKAEGILDRGPEYNAIFPSENDLVTTASDASRLAVEAKDSPEKRSKHNEAKAKMGTLAEIVIQQMRTTSVKDLNFANIPKNLQRAPGPLPDVPLYEIRQDGVYVLSGLDGARSPSPLMTRRYWAAKALTGYTQEEILNARTVEGVQIPQANLDATEYLYFKSAEEFAAAVDEFTKSSGNTGVIAERYLPLTGMTFEEFRSAQFNLIGFRKPLG
jgi:hypothetical protein